MAQIDDDDITIVSRPSQPNLTADSARHCPKCGLAVADATSVCPQDGTQIFEAQQELLAAKYEFITVAGSGGMSVVYKARRQGSGEVVAIKMMHSLLMNDHALKRFQQEAKAIKSLRHPNIINVHDFGVSEHGQPYMVMDFIDGSTLADVIKETGGLTVDQSLHRFIQLCDALEHAHEVGVLHRDLKPSNIMISNRDGNFADARIVDFGIAKLLDKEDDAKDDGHLTRTGELFGSPLYMSPEQCRGSQVDARSDIYSMGCVMYESLTGRPPLKGASMVETFVLQMTEVPISMSETCPDKTFPEELESLIAKALAKDPDHRFQSMNELKYALMQIQPSHTVKANQYAARHGLVKLPPISKTFLTSMISIVAGFIIAAFLIPPLLKLSQQSQENKLLNADKSAARIQNPKIDLAAISKRTSMIKEGFDGGDQELIESLKYGDLGMTRVDLSYAQPPIHDISAKMLGNLRSLTELNLDDDNQIGDETLQAIETLPITRICLRRTAIDDQGINYLIHMKDHLKELYISGTRVSDKGIETIASSFHLLQRLSISNLKFKNQSFMQLKTLPLEHLHADRTQVNDEGVSALADMQTLRDLKLNYTAIGDKGISHLINLKGLTELGVSYTNITDEMTSSLKMLSGLKELDIGGTKISNQGVKQLTELKQLQSLSLADTKITDSAALSLGLLSNLETLSLANCDITDAGVESISNLKNMRTLDLTRTKVTDSGLAKLYKLKKLRELTLYDCPNITIKSLRKLHKENPKLRLNLLAAITAVEDSIAKPVQRLQIRSNF